MTITERERIALLFMRDRISAIAYQIGATIWTQQTKRGGSNLISIGNAVLGRLRKRGLVTYLRDCEAWRITTKGRDAIISTHKATER